MRRSCHEGNLTLAQGNVSFVYREQCLELDVETFLFEMAQLDSRNRWKIRV